MDFGAPDGPADLVFLIAAPEGGEPEHMKMLTALARPGTPGVRRRTSGGRLTADDVVALVDGVARLSPTPAAQKPAPAATPATPPATKSVIAITACPTGIAHTYMAADALKLAAERAGDS